MEKSKLIMALGSNCCREENMKRAEEMICRLFNDDVVFTRALLTTPIGIDSDMFLNRLAAANTTLGIDTVKSELKAIESDCGRTREDKERNIVRMDIDILQYDNTIFHAEDHRREYVKVLLEELDGMM